MDETLLRIDQMMRSLINEVADLRERVVDLERQLEKKAPPRPPTLRPILLGAESYGSMGRIYSEGYHICPLAFGEIRDEGDCLFCVNILESK